MHKNILPLLAVSLLFGCATFKELEPEPKINSAENGFIDIREGEKSFILHREAKHFIRFPAPQAGKFYLILRTPPDSILHPYLTRNFDDGRGAIEKIPDEALSDTLAVYAIDDISPYFHWVIDVGTDMPLLVYYRYVPRWRYTFENKRVEYRGILSKNRVDQSLFNALAPGYDLDRIDIKRERDFLKGRNEEALALRLELTNLGELFPANIATGKDTAYLQYLELTESIDKELSFQHSYGSALDIFLKERDNRGNSEQFYATAPEFSSFLRENIRLPARIKEKLKEVLAPRLAGATTYFDRLLYGKKDLGTITSPDNLPDLYDACGIAPPADLPRLIRFIKQFNIEVSTLADFEPDAKKVEQEFEKLDGYPSEAFFPTLIKHTQELTATIPQSGAAQIEKYGSYPCAVLLDKEHKKARNRASAMLSLYQRGGRITSSVNGSDWSVAEDELIDLHGRDEWAPYPVLVSQRDLILQRFDQEILTRVTDLTRRRAQEFITENELAIDNIPALYADSAFSPVYLFRYSAIGPDETVRKRDGLRMELAKFRDVRLPEAAIKALYREFQKNVNDKGVERARAIVEHGKRYKGNDLQVKGLVNECDATVAKSIVRPREYRKVYALPIRVSAGGTLEYIFKLQLKIPSTAQFPVFDINIKLPEEVASKANKEQWYKAITINNKPIKNEGRFRITSPAAENNYESLITPVQMDKGGNNVLEVRFMYPGARVFEVSAMAQVPIIRKN